MSLKNESYFVFIESNTTGTGRIFIQEAIKKGFTLLFLTSNPEKYSFLQAELIQPVILDTRDVSVISAYLSRIKSIKAVISTSEYFVETAARVAQRLNLIHNNVAAINTCRRKDKLYQKLHAAQIAVPHNFSVVNEQEALQAYQRFKSKLVIKPSMGSGSSGVKLCKTAAEVKEQARHLLNQYQASNTTITSPSILVQEFIEGEEYSVEAISVNGKHTIIGITKKYLGSLPYFVELGHDFPASCTESEERLLESTVIKALDAIEFTYGPSHTELRIYNAKAYIIEINPRLAGGMIPVLIKVAKGIDLIRETIHVFLGENTRLNASNKNFASIRFLAAQSAGLIQKLQFPDIKIDHIYQAEFIKSEGSLIEINGDFRDRLGYVITCADSAEQSLIQAENYLKNSEIIITNNLERLNENSAEAGLLKRGLHPQALQIVNKKYDVNQKLRDFNYFVKLDEAHLLMLQACKIINKQNLAVILKALSQLSKENFASLLTRVATRGTYLLYENELIARLGLETAGRIHAGRSRNDLQETIFRLAMREDFFRIYHSLWGLRSQMLTISEMTLDQSFPIYSQYQTALPGNFAHYLLGIEEALCRDQRSLQDLFKFLNVSPLGSGAGGGTSLPINPSLTAKWLGFDEVSHNSLDAIASKDLALRFLSTINILASTLCRLVEDLQLWSTAEFKFIRFPDNLSGGSSMMPQKRNPYLLEEIKAKISEMLGQLISAFSAIHKTPFGNSYEIKSVLNPNIPKSTELLVDAIDLTKIILQGMQFVANNITKSLKENLTVATYASEILAQNLYTTKEAHKIIGNIIHEAESGEDALNRILNFLADKNLAISVNPIDWAHANEFGNGPGKSSTKASLTKASERLTKQGHWYHEKLQRLKQAEDLKKNAIQAVLKQA